MPHFGITSLVDVSKECGCGKLKNSLTFPRVDIECPDLEVQPWH